jgi:diguanylate cyclase (GGDEF)-like protein
MNLPAIYVAVIYGLAVIFYYSYLESLSIYLYGMAILYYVASSYQPILLQGDVFLNGISNSIIAWIASMVIFKKYVNEFLKQKKIESKNKKLNEINEKLREISIRDKLTGIYNRRKLEEILQDIYQKAERYNNAFSVVLLDLDHFKKINDNYGHQVGDQVLKEVSSILLESIRNVDDCGRWGGEEFLIILPETELSSAVTLAKRLRKEIEEYKFSNIDILTSSFGVASYSPEKEIKDIIKEADEALYAAKEKGRNRVEKMN